jgi:hypothetical protein
MRVSLLERAPALDYRLKRGWVERSETHPIEFQVQSSWVSLRSTQPTYWIQTMLRVLPSQALMALDDLFGPARTELYEQRTTGQFRTEVSALLELLDEIPRDLVDLPLRDYVEFLRCKGSLITALARWGAGDETAARQVGNKEPIECIRRLLKQCRDELPPPEPELPFIAELDKRLGIEDQIHTAWANYNAREWLGATTFAGVALESLLLWALKNAPSPLATDASLDKLKIYQLIDAATKSNFISEDTAKQAQLAKVARNLIHAGRASRQGMACSKGSSLAALAGLYRVIEDLKSRLVPRAE